MRPGTGIGHSGWRTFSTSMIFSQIHSAVPLVPMNDVGREGGADETVARIRVVMETDFERHQPVLAQIHGVLDALVLEIPEVDLAAVLELADLLEVEARHEGVRRRPFGRDHHVVARLVPEVVVELHAAQVVLPSPDDVEVLVQVQEAAGRVSPCVAEHRDDDVGAEAVHGMRGRQIGLGLDLGAFDHLVQARGLLVDAAVDDVQIRRADAGHDQVAPLLGRIVMARRAGVPARVMQLVADARHLQPADDLAVGGALRVRVDGRQVVRFLDAGADIEGDCVKDLLARRLHRLGRRGIARPAAMRSAVLSHVAPPPFALSAARVTQSAAALLVQLSR